MVSLKAFQEEIKELIFFRESSPVKSKLWDGAIPARLGVYRNNTRSNWTDTLDHDFPLTRRQFGERAWEPLRKKFFIKHPPEHWELNQSMMPFVRFLKNEKVPPYVKELADYEWNDLKVFIDRATVRSQELGHPPLSNGKDGRASVKRGTGVTNPTAILRAYQHQIFFWVQAEANSSKPPAQKPEVLVFYRDSRNTCHIRDADPLMILCMEHFRKPNAKLEDLEPLRRRMLPANKIPLETVLAALKKDDLIL